MTTAPARLSREACQRVVDSVMASLEGLTDEEVLARYRADRLDEVAIDEATKLPYRLSIFVGRLAEQPMLCVGVTPEPRPIRRAQRFRLLADFIEGWRNAPRAGGHRMLRPRASAPDDN